VLINGPQNSPAAEKMAWLHLVNCRTDTHKRVAHAGAFIHEQPSDRLAASSGRQISRSAISGYDAMTWNSQPSLKFSAETFPERLGTSS
jgi:hypothetical protein